MPPKKKTDARGGVPKPGTKQAKAAAEKTAESAKKAAQQPADEQKKPSVKQVIGGASWTGKLPVNMMSEHCQKHKWEKPEYTMVSKVAIAVELASLLMYYAHYRTKSEGASSLL
jgi:predicted lipid-binding transport protein (Tim44 family)